jgi:acetoin utilization protein AcuB
MLVRDVMTSDPITIRPQGDPRAALGLCKSGQFRRLPVVDGEGHVVGIVTRGMLERFLATAPPPTIQARQHGISQMMAAPVITVSPDDPMEEAARLMVAHKVGSIPVVEQDRLVGIITETDIFKEFVEILGGQTTALRLTVIVPDVPGSLARVVNAVAGLRGNIRSAIILPCEDTGCRAVTLWIEGLNREGLTEAVARLEGVRLTRLWSPPPVG